MQGRHSARIPSLLSKLVTDQGNKLDEEIEKLKSKIEEMEEKQDKLADVTSSLKNESQSGGQSGGAER